MRERECVCICVCVYVCMYECASVCMHMCVCVCVCVCKRERECVYMWMYMCVCVCVCVLHLYFRLFSHRSCGGKIRTLKLGIISRWCYWLFYHHWLYIKQCRITPGNTKGGSITVPLTSCLTGLESAVWQLTSFVFICKTEYSKPVKQEVNGTVILPLLVFSDNTHYITLHDAV